MLCAARRACVDRTCGVCMYCMLARCRCLVSCLSLLDSTFPESIVYFAARGRRGAARASRLKCKITGVSEITKRDVTIGSGLGFWRVGHF